VYSGFEGGSGFGVASGYNPVLREFFEEVFDQVMRFIQEPVIAARRFTVGSGRDDRFD